MASGGAISLQAPGKPSLPLSHELYLHGKYEPLWATSKRRGFHCPGFRPGPGSPAAPGLSPGPTGLGTALQEPQPSPCWPGSWTLGSAWPSPSPSILDAAKELRPASGFLLPVSLTNSASPEGGRGGGEEGRREGKREGGRPQGGPFPGILFGGCGVRLHNRFNHFESNSVAFSTFTTLCNHHHSLFWKYLHHPEKKPHTH